MARDKFESDGRGHITLLLRVIVERASNQDALCEPTLSPVDAHALRFYFLIVIDLASPRVRPPGDRPHGLHRSRLAGRANTNIVLHSVVVTLDAAFGRARWGGGRYSEFPDFDHARTGLWCGGRRVWEV